MKKIKAFLIVATLSWVAAISSFSLASDINPQPLLDGNKTSVAGNTNGEAENKVVQSIEDKNQSIEKLKKSIDINSLTKDQQEELKNVIQEYSQRIAKIIKEAKTDNEDNDQELVNAKYQKVFNKYVKKLKTYAPNESIKKLSNPITENRNRK